MKYIVFKRTNTSGTSTRLADVGASKENVSNGLKNVYLYKKIPSSMRIIED